MITICTLSAFQGTKIETIKTALITVLIDTFVIWSAY